MTSPGADCASAADSSCAVWTRHVVPALGSFHVVSMRKRGNSATGFCAAVSAVSISATLSITVTLKFIFLAQLVHNLGCVCSNIQLASHNAIFDEWPTCPVASLGLAK